MNSATLSKEWLIAEYSVKKRSMASLAAERGCSSATIFHKLHEFSIPTRDAYPINHIELSPGLMEIVGGGLLGGGCMRWSGAGHRSAHYVHGTKHKLYLEWLVKQLARYGVEIIGHIYEHHRLSPSTQRPLLGYSICTKAYREFAPIRVEWYREEIGRLGIAKGIKHIPEDFKLTPRKLLHWWIGDGSFARPRGKGNGWGYLATNAFDTESIEILRTQLKLQDIETNITRDSRDKEGYLIYIPAGSIPRFFEYMPPCPKEIESIYGYKWP